MRGLVKFVRVLATAGFMAWALGAGAVETPQFDVENAGSSGAIAVTASADMQVDRRTAWNVISDYDHLADFIPDMHSSRVTQRIGNQLLVEQTGQFGFLFFRQPVEVRLAVVESPLQRIVAKAVGGNLKEMEGLYTLEELPAGGVRLSYSGRVAPAFPVPAFIGRMVVRNAMARQFTAMVKEIQRREAVTGGSPPGR